MFLQYQVTEICSITYMPAPYYLTKRGGLSYEESTSIIGNKGLVNYVHDYDENLASKDKG
jgi:hypothetical protein